MLQYSIKIKDGRSIGLTNFGRTYTICETSYIWLNCDFETAKQLASDFGAEYIVIKRKGQGQHGGYQDVVWRNTTGTRDDVYQAAIAHDNFLNKKYGRKIA